VVAIRKIGWLSATAAKASSGSSGPTGKANQAIIIITKVSIHTKITIVKDVFENKLCYTFVMSTIDPNQPTNHSECGALMQRALRLLGDMWTLMIIYQLLNGPRRFGELLEVLGNVSPRTVSQRLKMLEMSGFVQRQAFAEIPPRVEYRLTEKGLALLDIMEAIRQFAEQHLAESEEEPPPLPATPPPCP
jgi:DNA-binding HxlR family transcriptional regulator